MKVLTIDEIEEMHARAVDLERQKLYSTSGDMFRRLGKEAVPELIKLARWVKKEES